MHDSKPKWQGFHAQQQQEEQESRQAFNFHQFDHHRQEQNTAKALLVGYPSLFPHSNPQGQPQGQQQTSATFLARQGGGNQENGAASPINARVKELLAAQREHLLAAVEIDHQLHEIWRLPAMDRMVADLEGTIEALGGGRGAADNNTPRLRNYS
ncbi:hypothetical protein CDEST_15313 [Colletotrichum destructivum]|uniref:Uncharacterized protein n=1 Tax=Colletotrichum destructivum TaxID=34406 RepID=A0AAX4J3Y5_9PEZI|nr:hypothetical protein CDEST_15313 [Colletotrichum destructivum]